MSTSEKKSETSTAENGQTAKIVGIVVMVVVVIAIAAFAISKSGNAEGENAKGQQTAAADASGEPPMIKLGNPVVANVNGEEIKRSDVFNFISGLPEQVRQMPIQTLFPLALEQVVNNRVINSMATSASLDADPEVEQLVTQAKGQIIRNVFVDRQISEQMTQKRLLKAYEDLLGTLGDVEEVKARHILVDDEAKARELVAQLDGGADFETLAKENSTGPSASRGGDLGYFAKNEMVAEFSDAAFKLNPGEYSKEPVKTQFGWHIIKVEEKRQRPEPDFEMVKPQLESQLRQQILAELLQKWQKEAKIKKFDINGEEIKQN